MAITYNLKTLEANMPDFDDRRVPAIEIGNAKRRMDGAFRRMTTLSDERVRLGKILRQKGVSSDEGFVRATNAMLIATRVKYNQATLDFRSAKDDYRLYKKDYLTGTKMNTKMHREALREKIDITRIKIQVPEMKRELCAVLYNAYAHDYRAEIDDLRLLAQERKTKDFREKFDAHMPMLDEALYSRVSQVATVKTEILSVAMKFLRGLSDDTDAALVAGPSPEVVA
jgi:hypothetical protein